MEAYAEYEDRGAEARRLFSDFLVEYPRESSEKKYLKILATVVASGGRRLTLDLADLYDYDKELARDAVLRPVFHIPIFRDVLRDVFANEYPGHLGLDEEVHVGFSGPFANRVTPRELHVAHLGQVVCMEGIVTKISLVRPKVVNSVHYCGESREFTVRSYRDITSYAGLPTSSVYPQRDDEGRLLTTEYGLSRYRDNQTITVQEMPESAPAGQMPCSVDVIVEDDLTDSCKPGDRIAVVGVYRALGRKTNGSTSGMFSTTIIATAVTPIGRETALLARRGGQGEGSAMSDQVRILAADPKGMDLLSASIAPAIYGQEVLKRAVLLTLLGGVEKVLSNGAHLRGDINILMVGDPSVAKSQMMRAIMRVAPLSISTTGRGSSGVGLTAAVTSDPETGERQLEAGAMVLADRGIVCIDEFDKMSDVDRVAIHEVMEQQTVTISKAGVHCSLNARCSVVAAANPVYGSYNRSKSPMQNIGLPDSLVSRFDLLFVLLDSSTRDYDRDIAGHVLKMHQLHSPNNETMVMRSKRPFQAIGSHAEGVPTVSPDLLRAFIVQARQILPQLSLMTCDSIVRSYSALRRSDEGSLMYQCTPRTLEALVRLATANAKGRLSALVEPIDAEAAFELVKHTISTDAISVTTGTAEKSSLPAAKLVRLNRGSTDGIDSTHAIGGVHVGDTQRRGALEMSSGASLSDLPVPGIVSAHSPDSRASRPDRIADLMAGVMAYHAHVKEDTFLLEDMLAYTNASASAVPGAPFSESEAIKFLPSMQDILMYTDGMICMM